MLCGCFNTRLMKAGFLPKHRESAVSKVSAWAEVLGYAANILLSINKYQQLLQQEQALARKIQSLKKVGRDLCNFRSTISRGTISVVL